MSKLRFGVAGAGATGGFLAAILADAGYEVTLLARGKSADVIADNGVVVHSAARSSSLHARPARVIRAEDPVEPVDITLFCVKSYDTAKAVKATQGLVGGTGRILCLQNGIANEDALAEAYGSDRVLSGVLYIGSERTAPGVIECRTDAVIKFGPYLGDATRPIWEPLREALAAAGVSCSVDGNIRSAKWQKFLFNCGLNPITALTRQRLGSIRANVSGAALFEALVEEVLTVARASGAPIATDARQQVDSTADRMDISSSMAEDLLAGRPMEIDAFTGYVLKLAEAYEVDVPTTRVVDRLLRVMDQAASSRS